jgi:hypothetical protein
MASRRILKKSINNLTFDLISECYIYKHFNPGKKDEQVGEVLEDIARKRNDLVQQVNHPTNKNDYKKNRKYFREVAQGMNSLVGAMDKLAKK